MVFADHEWRVPLDVDSWPLDVIKSTVWSANGSVTVNRRSVVAALETILGQQWPEFLAKAVPVVRDLVPASRAVAAAAGFPGDGDDKAFGGLPRLLSVLDLWPHAVESDLNRFWQLDYRDRWRFTDGRRRLTLRQINARISHLPADSALAVKMKRRSPTELLLMDLYELAAGRAHPERPLSPEQIAARKAEAERAAKAREAYEQRRIAQGHRGITSGLETARANARRTS